MRRKKNTAESKFSRITMEAADCDSSVFFNSGKVESPVQLFIVNLLSCFEQKIEFYRVILCAVFILFARSLSSGLAVLANL